MKKYLWIGMYATDGMFEEMATKGYKQSAAHTSQQNLIKGFEDNLNTVLDTINAYVLPPYPDYREKWIVGKSWSHTIGAEDYSVGFYNRKYVNHLSRIVNLKKAVRNWAIKNSNNEVVIFVYSMHSPFMNAAKEVKKLIPDSQIFLIVPDLPQYMDLGMNGVKKFLKSLDWHIIKRLMKYVDGYILYSKHMAKFLNLPENKWMVMEGSLNKSSIFEAKILEEKPSKISVMYSGVIDKRYGVIELLDAFSLIGDLNYELWFTGMGNAVSLVEERAKKDKRIKCFGFLPSKKDVIAKQQQATMLINMRLPTEAASAYCFPSKLFEYMVSGRPVLSFRIPGIPDEYYEYLVELKSTNISDIANVIKTVGNMSPKDRMTLGTKAQKFILENKNAKVQTNKILQYFEL